MGNPGPASSLPPLTDHDSVHSCRPGPTNQVTDTGTCPYQEYFLGTVSINKQIHCIIIYVIFEKHTQ